MVPRKDAPEAANAKAKKKNNSNRRVEEPVAARDGGRAPKATPHPGKKVKTKAPKPNTGFSAVHGLPQKEIARLLRKELREKEENRALARRRAGTGRWRPMSRVTYKSKPTEEEPEASPSTGAGAEEGHSEEGGSEEGGHGSGSAGRHAGEGRKDNALVPRQLFAEDNGGNGDGGGGGGAGAGGQGAGGGDGGHRNGSEGDGAGGEDRDQSSVDMGGCAGGTGGALRGSGGTALGGGGGGIFVRSQARFQPGSPPRRSPPLAPRAGLGGRYGQAVPPTPWEQRRVASTPAEYRPVARRDRVPVQRDLDVTSLAPDITVDLSDMEPSELWGLEVSLRQIADWQRKYGTPLGNMIAVDVYSFGAGPSDPRATDAADRDWGGHLVVGGDLLGPNGQKITIDTNVLKHRYQPLWKARTGHTDDPHHIGPLLIQGGNNTTSKYVSILPPLISADTPWEAFVAGTIMVTGLALCISRLDIDPDTGEETPESMIFKSGHVNGRLHPAGGLHALLHDREIFSERQMEAILRAAGGSFYPAVTVPGRESHMFIDGQVKRKNDWEALHAQYERQLAADPLCGEMGRKVVMYHRLEKDMYGRTPGGRWIRLEEWAIGSAAVQRPTRPHVVIPYIKVDR